MEKKLLKRIEEMGDTERDKLLELLKDSKSVDESQKLNWMYKDKVDNEEYLLGRRIDKAMVVEPEIPITAVPGALFSDVISRRSELDMQVKMREDPLYMIRKREEEAKRKLLENPVKMKELQKVIDEQKHNNCDKKKKKKKKHKKSSDESSDDELLRKYLSIVKQKKSNASRAESGLSVGEQSKPSVSQPVSRHDISKHSKDISGRQRSGDDIKPLKGKERHEDEKNLHENRRDREKKHKRSRDDERPSRSRTRSRSPRRQKPDGYGLIRPNGERADVVPVRPSAPTSLPKSTVKDQPKAAEPFVKRKLTEEEKERKRVEMMENARDRDAQRYKNVEKYKMEDEREKKKMVQQMESHDADFVKPLVMKHASQSSVSDRIKRNVYNIQRNNADHDRNFVRH